MRTPPCNNCKDRVSEPNCHATCEKYLQFAKQRKEELKEIQKNKQKYRY